MKRTAAQAAFPAKWDAAKRRRIASRANRAAITSIIRSRADKRQITANANTDISTTGAIYNMMTNMVRGDNSVNNFSGEFISWQWAKLRWICRAPNAGEHDTIRVILFQWDDSVAPTVGNVLDLANGVVPVLAPHNFRNRRILRVLHDEATTVVTNASNWEVSRKTFIAGRRINKTWFGSSTTSPVKNGVFVLVVSDSFISPNPSVEFSFEGVVTDEI